MEKPRFLYIDLMRGWAVLVMVEVHVFNAFILSELRDTVWFEVLNFVNGLVAPSFLFISGYSFVLVAQRKWNDYLSFNSIFWKQAARILQILAVGYALHLPKFSFTALWNLSWEEWSVFWKIDVLHAIAVSLFVMLLLVIIFREQRKYFFSIVLLMFVVIVFSPLMYDKNIDHLMPVPLANYFTAAHRSQFPLFPWMAFVLFGGIFAQIMLWWKKSVEDKKIFLRFSVVGFLFIVVALITKIIPIELFPPHDFWRASPAFFFIRLGIVVNVLVLLWFWEQHFKSQKSLVSIVGSESLIAYASHLLIIYGQFFNDHSLAYLIGKTKNAPEVMIMTSILIAITVAISYFWHRIKNWSMFYARVLIYSVLSVVLYIFFTKPY